MRILLLLLIPVLFLIGCSSKDDADYKAEAEEHIKKGNAAEAITAYENLVKEFPKSEQAPEAISQIASLYQNKLVKNLSQKESMEKAAETFRRVYEKYPNSKQAPKSLFMSGFILANELKKYDNATETYKVFLSKYPNHELAKAAKDELETMGLTPEEIINRKKNLTGS